MTPEPLLNEAQLVRTTDELVRFLADLKPSRVVGIDTESAGFHRYRSDLSLIQVAGSSTCALLDPMSVKDFSPLAEFALDPRRQWVFHGADFDLRMLAQFAQVRFQNIFDTRVAAEILGCKALSLTGLSETLLGLPLDKKLQRCDWARRPLTPAMMRYGLLDAVCLPPVRARLRPRLQRRGRLAWHDEEVARLLAQDYTTPKDDTHAWAIKGARHLSPAALTVLHELHGLRDRLAARRDRSPFMVISNDALLEMARQAPQSMAGLSVIRGIGDYFIQRHGQETLAAIRRAVALPPTPWPTDRDHDRPRHAQLTAYEGELLQRLRQLRDNVARKVGIDPTVLANSQVLEQTARLRPDCPADLAEELGISRWRADLLHPAFADELARPAPQSNGENSRRRRRRRGGRSRHDGSHPTGEANGPASPPSATGTAGSRGREGPTGG